MRKKMQLTLPPANKVPASERKQYSLQQRKKGDSRKKNTNQYHFL